MFLDMATGIGDCCPNMPVDLNFQSSYQIKKKKKKIDLVQIYPIDVL